MKPPSDSAAPTRPDRPLFEQVGGEAGIRAILDDLYAILFDDLHGRLSVAGHDREKIVRLQTVFTRRMLGDATAVSKARASPTPTPRCPSSLATSTAATTCSARCWPAMESRRRLALPGSSSIRAFERRCSRWAAPAPEELKNRPDDEP